MIFLFGKSGNKILNKFISEKRLKWIPYKKFQDVVYLDKGGFGTVYKAIWLNKDKNKKVVLKCLNNLNENLNEFLDEWKYHEICSGSLDIINLYGFTKDSNTPNYMVVIDYANNGNLRKNLSKVITNDWKQRLNMLYKIISGLYEIHKQNLIHCDLHDGNILIHVKKGKKKEKDDVNSNLVFISDLGLCHPVKSSLKEGEIFGIIPFMAPEILRGKPYTPASDIYSFSMIMWEFTSGISPFINRAHDLQLTLSICGGDRPEIIENTPQCYVDLMKKCWNEDPLKRPSASDVKYAIGNWIFNFDYNEETNEEIKSNVMEFINAPIGNNDLATEFHPQAHYTSRLLDFTSDKLNENLAIENLDDCEVKI
ncbi:kinase-like domain-containing protein [Rhizophagus irregularis DAOM 181602=DAOM 197198]|nr:kinase-like domain-containing protein [Rhizophagus irregularis DAOM 181602=DAOM 197198]